MCVCVYLILNREFLLLNCQRSTLKVWSASKLLTFKIETFKGGMIKVEFDCLADCSVKIGFSQLIKKY